MYGFELVYKFEVRNCDTSFGRCPRMKTYTIREISDIWGISISRIARLCREGRIEGAIKDGRSWLIPIDAARPTDQRVKTGSYMKEQKVANLPLPVGIADYRKASKEYYYIDKTLLIKDFLDERPMVTLFTRPRRFGKTLNMDMLRTFFEKTEEDTKIYFEDKKIWKCGQTYRDYQGKYPVIFVTFKDVKCETWEETKDLLFKILRNEFERHRNLLESEKLSDYEKQYIKNVLSGEANENDMAMSFLNLTRMLDEHYGIAPILIIDEYDTPIQEGYLRGYYDKVVLFMRNLFSGGLKDNRHLSYGFLTGILRVAKESIFSGLNNLKINSVLDNKYSEYFGFTTEEIREMAEYYGVSEKYDEICEWYDGYRFGKTDIFNPWSVINYFSNECIPRAYWVSTGSNDIIGEILSIADEEILKHLENLMQEESFLTYIDMDVIYPQIKSDPSSIYSFLLVTGYLKMINTDYTVAGDYMCEVALPNKELSLVYSKEILNYLQYAMPRSLVISIQEAVYRNDVEKLQTSLQKLLYESVSYYDVINENFYHGLVLGLCAMFDEQYYLMSNRESGEGRYDIQLMPKDNKHPGILLELKAGKDDSEDALKILARKALNQIEERKYDTEMRARGVEKIIKYGIAFSGKKVEITGNI